MTELSKAGIQNPPTLPERKIGLPELENTGPEPPDRLPATAERLPGPTTTERETKVGPPVAIRGGEAFGGCGPVCALQIRPVFHPPFTCNPRGVLVFKANEH